MRFIAALVFTISLQAQSDLEQVVSAEMARQQIPGVVVVGVRGDRIAYARGFGVASVETKEPVTPDTLFRAGSTTKMMVAAAAARLAGEGRLRLNAPISDYMFGLHPRIGRLTAHQLLSHTAGVAGDSRMFGAHDDVALADTVRSFDESMLFASPGRVYSYSNAGFVIAGRLVEVVKGLPFADAVSELVFQPVGMKRTTFRPTMAMTYPMAQGHQNGQVVRPAADFAGYWPAGSMFTSGNDFGRFLIAFLNEGKIDGDQALTPAMIEALTKPVIRTPGLAAERFYGYGLAIDSSRGTRVVAHTGSRLGYTTHAMMVLERKAGVMVLGNLNGGALGRIAERALEEMLGTRLGQAAPVPQSPVDPAAAAGAYTHGETRISITAREGSLWVRESKLEPAGGACYRTAGGGAYCFDRNFVHTGGRAYVKVNPAGRGSVAGGVR